MTTKQWCSCMALALGCGGWFAAVTGCGRERAAPSEQQQAAAQQGVLLSGEFRNGAKSASGQAEIVRQGDRHELRLHRVRVASPRAVRVYLVAADGASTTRAVVETEDKYDMAQLDQNTDEQRIALPGPPAPELRTVVLWDPEYGINLGYAALHPRSQ